MKGCYLCLHLSILVTQSLLAEGTNLHVQFSRIQPCFLPDCEATAIGPLRSKLECFSVCSRENSCNVLAYGDDQSCEFYSDTCIEGKNCGTATSALTFYQKNPCQHHGKWQETTGTCVCENGWVGSTCELLPTSCVDLYTYNYPEGLHTITLDLYGNSSILITAICHVGFRSALIFVMRNDGTQSHNRTWQDYVHGYYINLANYWIGLENFRILWEKQVGELRFNTHLEKFPEKGYFHVVYEIDSLSGESNGYRLQDANLIQYYESGKLSSYFEIGDFLSLAQGAAFSTADNDNDNEPDRNCAAEAGAGWWFSQCNHYINPLGRSYRSLAEAPRIRYYSLPGMDLSTPELRDAFPFDAMFFKLPI